ncbi:MAG: DUF971 domain-containing protein [Pseudomonadota bacterium]
MKNIVPSNIILHRKSRKLEVVFTGVSYLLDAEYLRVYSPSAEVKGHGPGQEVLQLNKENVAIKNVQAKGNYALQIIFDDGHDSGIYSWPYLYALATEHEQRWQDYLARVEQATTSTVKWVDP